MKAMGRAKSERVRDILHELAGKLLVTAHFAASDGAVPVEADRDAAFASLVIADARWGDEPTEPLSWRDVRAMLRALVRECESTIGED